MKIKIASGTLAGMLALSTYSYSDNAMQNVERKIPYSTPCPSEKRSISEYTSVKELIRDLQCGSKPIGVYHRVDYVTLRLDGVVDELFYGKETVEESRVVWIPLKKGLLPIRRKKSSEVEVFKGAFLQFDKSDESGDKSDKGFRYLVTGDDIKDIEPKLGDRLRVALKSKYDVYSGDFDRDGLEEVLYKRLKDREILSVSRD